ncbi:probable cystatin-16 [Dasypus novemcinctus]|uniref:probable cystatin-16 n=1 Tax=Dasypus novemcinctus TaxID=9361 RepID=UPI0003290789|nr:probable cystatin-16 [Dasypus novemcinctus]
MASLGTLLLRLVLLVGHVWTVHKEFYDINKNWKDFLMSVEFAVFQFNQDNEDEFAYNLQWVTRSQQKRNSHVYLMDVELGRTICRKHEEDLENCPLQEGPGEKKLQCTFVVDLMPWITKFTLLNSTCVEKQVK